MVKIIMITQKQLWKIRQKIPIEEKGILEYIDSIIKVQKIGEDKDSIKKSVDFFRTQWMIKENLEEWL